MVEKWNIWYLGIFLISVISVDAECYYDYYTDSYDCYANVSIVIGAVIGGLFGIAIIGGVVTFICCTFVKTSGIRGHVVQPGTLSTIHTVQRQQMQQTHQTTYQLQALPMNTCPTYNQSQMQNQQKNHQYIPPQNMAYQNTAYPTQQAPSCPPHPQADCPPPPPYY
ncbi:Hypothetical predicted protein [Mytilus galloprovincialis]|uniref:Cysteine and tyrosine-rich protein 1 n=1 Tax=Mytilus galloprovincialis TaxID=29158 RepID=A0A8B6H863_MYTGA|nr:Hypothetical predicted protein [Mytilus galloprovincialis]